MIDFRSTAPTYERTCAIKDRDGLREMGCSEELISGLCVGHEDSFVPLCPPEEWFWADRRRFGHGGPWVDELYAIAGGCFAELPLAEQCRLLGLEIETIRGTAIGGKKWQNHSGEKFRIEEFALQEIITSEEVGFALEGALLGAITAMVRRIAKHQNGRTFSLDMSAGMLGPSEEHIKQMMSSFDIFLERYEKLIEGLWPDMQATYRQVTVSHLINFVERISQDLLRSMLNIVFRHRTGVTGHPDLTLLGDSARFVEVKGKDRLWGTQGTWIRDVAIPIGLSVKIVKVIDA